MTRVRKELEGITANSALSLALAFGMLTYVTYYWGRLRTEVVFHANACEVFLHGSDLTKMALLVAALVGIAMIIIGQTRLRVLRSAAVLAFCLTAAHIIVGLSIDKVSVAFALSNGAELVVAATLWHFLSRPDPG